MKTLHLNKNQFIRSFFLLLLAFGLLQAGCDQNDANAVTRQGATNSSRNVSHPNRPVPTPIFLAEYDHLRDQTEGFTPDQYSSSYQYDGFRHQECDAKDVIQSLAPVERAIYCLRKICQETSGAHFDPDENVCACGPGFTFRSENRRGFCLPNRWVGNVSSDQNLGTARLAFSNAVPQNGSTTAHLNLSPFRLTNVILRTQGRPHSLSAQEILSRLMSSPPEFPTHFLSHVNFTVGALPNTNQERRIIAEQTYGALKADFDISSGFSLTGGGSDFSYYEPNPELLGAALGSKNATDHLNANQKRDFFSIGAEFPSELARYEEIQALPLILGRWEQIRTRFQADAATIKTLAGCAEFCILKQDLSFGLFPRLHVSLERTFFLGSKVSSKIVLRDAQTKTIKSAVLLNPGDGVSAILHIMPTAQAPLPRENGTNGSAFFTQLKVYDRHWQYIDGFLQNLELDLNSTLLNLQAQRLQPNAEQSTPRAAVCEVWPRTMGGLRGPLILGPNFNPQLSESNEYQFRQAVGARLGWGGRSISFEDFFGDSLMPSDWPHLSDVVDPHPVNVSNLYFSAGENPDGNHGAIAAVGAKNTCLSPDRYDTWRQELLDAGVRVMNLSFSTFKSTDLCREEYSRIFEDSQEPLLFVAAAGNEGWLGNRLLCPQNILSNRKNGIVVAALEGGTTHRLASYSNYGALSADIAAAVPDQFRVSGTSFASPVVTKAAAEIFARYPRLSVADVRYALLLSAQVDDFSRPLAVRSGGFLNGVNAKQIAALMDEHRRSTPASRSAEMMPFSTAELIQFIRRHECPGAVRRTNGTTCVLANQRIQLLKRNHVLEN